MRYAVRKNVGHFHEQSISILSIFSAVVLAFMGGISFSGSVLENFASVSMFRLIVTIVLLGFIVFNTIGILLRFVLRIVYGAPEKAAAPPGMVVLNIVLGSILVLTVVFYAVGIGNIVEGWGTAPAHSSVSHTDVLP